MSRCICFDILVFHAAAPSEEAVEAAFTILREALKSTVSNDSTGREIIYDLEPGEPLKALTFHIRQPLPDSFSEALIQRAGRNMLLGFGDLFMDHFDTDLMDCNWSLCQTPDL